MLLRIPAARVMEQKILFLQCHILHSVLQSLSEPVATVIRHQRGFLRVRHENQLIRQNTDCRPGSPENVLQCFDQVIDVIRMRKHRWHDDQRSRLHWDTGGKIHAWQWLRVHE